MKKLTRRHLVRTVLASAAPAVLAQTPPATPESDLKAARDRLKATGEALAAQAVPLSTEPAFQFRA